MSIDSTENNNEIPNTELSALSLLQSNWENYSHEERVLAFKQINRLDAEELFLSLNSSQQHDLIVDLPNYEKRGWLRLLPPDDCADLIQEFLHDERSFLLTLLDETTRGEVTALLDYAEDEAGGLMNPRFVRLRPDVNADVAIRYLRMQARSAVEIISYAYVLDNHQKLLGVISYRELLMAVPEKLVSEIMHTDVISIPAAMDQEEIARQLSVFGLQAIPVVDSENRMMGIITLDDVVDVVKEEATEDMQKLGGTEALEYPYLETSIWHMVKKRGGWLTVLFVGETMTIAAMSNFEHELAKAVVLATFIPLIIASGGNSGSQATSLIIRALALKEVRLRDWRRVLTREVISGLGLGAILGALGLLSIVMWPNATQTYGEHFSLIGIAVMISLVCVVLWGSIAGSMLPFVLKRFNFDPASASAPLVATLVDVTGLTIYFTVAQLILSGTLL